MDLIIIILLLLFLFTPNLMMFISYIALIVGSCLTVLFIQLAIESYKRPYPYYIWEREHEERREQNRLMLKFLRGK